MSLINQAVFEARRAAVIAAAQLRGPSAMITLPAALNAIGLIQPQAPSIPPAVQNLIKPKVPGT